MNTVASLPAKLLPCPFCGAVMVRDFNGACFVHPNADAIDCPARYMEGYTSEEIAAWNRRASPAPSAPAKQAESPLIGAWTDADMKKPWGLEAASLRHLADDPALNVEQSAMLRHCAKRIESTAGIQLRALADMLDPAKQAGVLRDAADALSSPSAPVVERFVDDDLADIPF